LLIEHKKYGAQEPGESSEPLVRIGQVIRRAEIPAGHLRGSFRRALAGKKRGGERDTEERGRAGRELKRASAKNWEKGTGKSGKCRLPPPASTIVEQERSPKKGAGRDLVLLASAQRRAGPEESRRA